MKSELQNKLLEMLKWIVNYIEKHNLTYYVISGTMLGAARHSGFIPWDDDVDIAMPRKDYEILINLLKTPVSHYYVESPSTGKKDYVYGFAKFYDLETTLVEKLHKPVKRGIYIDIFPLDGIGNNEKEARRNYKKIDKINMLLTMKTARVRKGRKLWKNIAAIIGKLIPLNANKLAKKLDAECSKMNYDECRYVGSLMSTYRAKEIIKKAVYGKPTVYCFEELNVFGPEKCEEYLTKLFGDWKKLPPIEKRHSPHDFADINFSKPFGEE